MTVTVKPGKASGTPCVRGSKSYAHRLLVIGALTRGTYTLRNMPASDDILATESGLRAFGYSVLRDGDTVTVGDRIKDESPVFVDCGDSASTLRFLIPLAWVTGTEARFEMSEALRKRPLGDYEALARRAGVKMTYDARCVSVSGKLTEKNVSICGEISSQFASGLLMAGVARQGDFCVCLKTPCESRPYLAMTVHVLRLFGYNVLIFADRLFTVKSRKRMKSESIITVPTDASSTAYFGALNSLGGKVALPEDDINQPDSVWKNLMPKLKDRFCTVSLNNCPDLAPVLFVQAALCRGGRFTGTCRLAYKESDRARVMATELKKCGADITVLKNEVMIRPCTLHTSDRALECHNDHRVAMALGVLVTVIGGTINGAECVSKSFPDYWIQLKKLGIEIGGLSE